MCRGAGPESGPEEKVSAHRENSGNGAGLAVSYAWKGKIIFPISI